jgi:subtilisin family serine protease
MTMIEPFPGSEVHALATQQLVLISVMPGTDINAVASAYQGKVLGSLGTDTYLLQVGTLTPVTPVSGVLSVEPDSAVNPGVLKGGILTVPPGKAPGWYSTQPALSKVGVGSGYISTGQGIVIADIDAAADYSHPALAGHLTGGYDFILGAPAGTNLNQSSADFLDQSSADFLDQSSADFLDSSSPYLDPQSMAFLTQSSADFLDQTTEITIDKTAPYHGHGTLVAGVLAAVAPGAMIMPIRAFTDQGQSDIYTISKAIYWAVNNGANVINMSFGTLTNSETMQGAIQYAQQHGVVLVSSAGNDGLSEQIFPANYSGVLSVASTNYLDLVATFSNYGSQVEVSAPGVAIIGPYPGGYYAVASGTSFSAPIVAGEAALILSQALSQGMTAQQANVASTIMQGATDISHINPNKPVGGRVNVNTSVRSLTPPLTLQLPSGSAASGWVGTPYNAALTASGGFPPYVFSTSALPSGLSLNPSTGAITGIPTATVSNFAVTGRAVDVTGFSVTATGNFSFAAATALKVKFSGSLSGQIGAPFSVSLIGTGGYAPYTFSINALPAGLTLDPSTGAITGTPSSVSSASVTATVVDSTGTSATVTGTFKIVPPTLQLQFPAANGEIGAPFSDTLTATGGYPPYTFSIPTPPGGLTVNSSTGAITGKPNTVNSSPVAATVVDSTGASAKANALINIVAKLQLQFPGVNGSVGVPYTNSLTVTGGAPGYTFSSSVLPAGLSLDPSTGAITGTPTTATSLKVTATVVDGWGYSTSVTASVNIAATLKVKGPGNSGQVGTPYSSSLTASGGIPPYMFSISTLPAGLTLDSSSGAITGTPTSPVSNLSLTSTVADSTGASATASSTITIAATLSLKFPGGNGTVGIPYSTSVTATGGIPPYTLSITALPAGVTLDPVTGIISGTPTATFSAKPTATVVDSTGASVSVAGSISIAAAAQLQLQIPGVKGYVGTPYSNTLAAKGGVPPYTFSINALPAGLTLDHSTGAITGIPTTVVSNFAVTGTVTDSFGVSATATGTITIAAATTLQLKLSSLSGQVGAVFVSPLIATGGSAPYTFSVSALPAGLTLDGTNAISGTPTAVSSAQVTATVVDSTGTSATATGTFKIVPPTLTLQFPFASGEAGFPFSSSLSASGGYPPYTFSIPYPPGGLKVNSSTGAITGTPNTVASTQVSATVTDSTGASAKATATINIVAKLQLQASGLNGEVGTPYSNTLNASGGFTPYTFSISSLPAGLTLNSTTGIISGTPTTSTSLKVTVTLADSYGASVTATPTINISPTLNLQFPGVNGAVGTPYSNSLAATGGFAPYTFSSTALPLGLVLNSSTGAITGIPTSESSIQVTATLVDATGVSVTATGTIKISTATQLKVQFPGASSMTGQVGTPYSISLTASGGFGPYTFSVSSLPAGLSLNPSTGAITGTPAAAVTSFSATATVVDSVGTTATATGSISINP